MLSLFTRFVSRLSVGRKLILIYALDLSAVIFVSGILISEKFIAIDFARKEMIGSQYIAVVRDVLRDYPQLPAQRAQAINALNAVEQAHGKVLGSAELVGNLTSLLGESGRIPLSRLAQSGQALITRIGNQSNLILDPDLDSYYTMSLVVLRFPELMEVADLIRAKAGEWMNATERERPRLETEYLLLEGRLDGIAKGIDSDYAEAVAAMQAEFAEPTGKARTQLREVIDAYREGARKLVFAADGVHSGRGIESSAGNLMQRLGESWIAASATLDQMLQRRIDELFQRMWLHLGTAASLLLLILSVVYFVARQIALPLGRLAHVADNVRHTGNYQLRAAWDSGDELGRLVAGFNSMLEQLNKSRLIEQEMIASKRATAAQKELLEAMPMPLVVTSIPEHTVLHSNAPAGRWLTDSDKNPWASSLNPETRVRFFQELAYHDAVNEFEVHWHGPDGPSWALLAARRLRYQDQDAVLTTFTPINGLKALEQRLELWSKVFEASSEIIIITDAERTFLTVNRAFFRVTDYEFDDIRGFTPDMLRADRHPEGFIDDIWRKAGLRGSWQGEMWIRCKSGEDIPLWAAINAVRDAQGVISHYIIAALDISEHKANEQVINHLAHHDGLTDLPNRLLCLERLRMAIQQAERQRARVGVLFIDLDRFKNINDSLGHHIGDGLLRSVAKALLSAVRLGDTVSRLGGDEFVVILNGVADVREVVEIVDQRLIPLVRQPHIVDGAELHVLCSVGISMYPEDGRDIETLMRNADAAMYQAKSSGRNNAQFFTSEMDFRARERLDIENDLRHALTRGEFRLYYQPRVDCRSGRLLGVEALVRWQHSERGLVMPANFITVAEESGLIIPIGTWIFEEACRQQALWASSEVGNIAISVNLSAAQLRDPDLVDNLRKALTDHAVNPQSIELELTETLLMEDVAATIDKLNALKALGVSLSVDDFGTGYSSLNYLHRFPIDKLKIDKSFVRDMVGDANNLAITRTIISLGHTLGLRVVAEGVEQEGEANMLTAAGCDELQGYLFSRPIPAEDLALWAARRR